MDPVFQVGDSVYLYHPAITQDQSAKLRSPWTGPHYIVEKFSNVNVKLRRQSDNSLVPGRIHVNRLKKATDRQLPMDSLHKTCPQKELTPTFKGIIIFEPGKQMTKINFYYKV